MIRALLDTNVILDTLLAREPSGVQAAAVWQAHEDNLFTGYICAITPPIVFYVARKQLGKQKALALITDITDTFEVCAVNKQVLQSALRLGMTDYEDAIHAASALAEGLEFIVTSNLRDFRKSPVKAVSPVEFLKQIR
jgi:predicted nucleic acid-binding protein